MRDTDSPFPQLRPKEEKEMSIYEYYDEHDDYYVDNDDYEDDNNDVVVVESKG